MFWTIVAAFIVASVIRAIILDRLLAVLLGTVKKTQQMQAKGRDVIAQAVVKEMYDRGWRP